MNVELDLEEIAILLDALFLESQATTGTDWNVYVEALRKRLLKIYAEAEDPSEDSAEQSDQRQE